MATLRLTSRRIVWAVIVMTKALRAWGSRSVSMRLNSVRNTSWTKSSMSCSGPNERKSMPRTIGARRFHTTRGALASPARRMRTIDASSRPLPARSGKGITVPLWSAAEGFRRSLRAASFTPLEVTQRETDGSKIAHGATARLRWSRRPHDGRTVADRHQQHVIELRSQLLHGRLVEDALALGRVPGKDGGRGVRPTSPRPSTTTRRAYGSSTTTRRSSVCRRTATSLAQSWSCRGFARRPACKPGAAVLLLHPWGYRNRIADRKQRADRTGVSRSPMERAPGKRIASARADSNRCGSRRHGMIATGLGPSSNFERRKSRSRANSPLRVGQRSATLSHVTESPRGAEEAVGRNRP